MTAGEIAVRLRAKLAEELATPLDAADERTSFFQLGVDSVIATALIDLIRREFFPGCSVSALFDYPTVAALAGYLEGKRGGAPAGAGPGREGAAALARDDLDSPSSGAGTENSSAVRGDGSSYGPVAVIGMSGRFPGAADVRGFWEQLCLGTVAIRPVPAERSRYWDWAGLGKKRGDVRRLGGFLGGIEQFDPLFFNITPREAAVMDPQQRLFLEEAWKAVEDAGYGREELGGARCGIYAGVMNHDYQDLLAEATGRLPVVYELMGNAPSILAARMAYDLDVKGPAITVDTACSSSLVAVHLACRALQQGEITMALAGGVTLYLTERRYVLMEQAGMLSAEGACRPFDARADGMVPGEAVGVLVLKRLERAMADGDFIYGLIRGSGVNQDGRTNGITAPSMRAQKQLLREVWRGAGINPSTITYVEAHATGTRLGDPIEVEALTEAFREHTGRREYCRLGSVKANLGHTSAAAGIVGLIKVLLALRHGKIPPQAQFDEPNPQISLGTTPFRVNTQLECWEAEGGGRRRALVSAFGFSGTNSHVVIEESPAGARAGGVPGNDAARVFTLSARTPEALRRKAGDLLEFLRGNPEGTDLAALSFTLNCGRTQFEERLAWMGSNVSEVCAALEAFLTGNRGAIEFFRGTATAVDDEVRCERSAADRGARPEDLAQRWAAGEAVDWKALYAGGCPGRIPVPGYSFAKEEYWFDRVLAGEPLEDAQDARARPVPVPSAGLLRPKLQLKPVEALAVRAGGIAAAGGAGGHVEAASPGNGVMAHPAGAAGVNLEVVRGLVSRALCLPVSRVDTKRRFADLGLDSILAVELTKAIRASTGLNIPASSLYEHPTVEALCEFLTGLGAGSISVEPEFGFQRVKTEPGEAEAALPGMAAPLPGEAGATRRGTGLGRCLRVNRAGTLGEVEYLEEAELAGPGEGEARIRIEAATVMLADWLCVQGLYPTMPPYPFTPGFEVAGVVQAVGAGVTGMRVGDRVFGLTGGALGGHASLANVDARWLEVIPGGLTFARACTIPVAFLTARYALEEAGRLRQGEVLLIHSGASSTGLAAIQWARRLGARVFATVGSAEKMDYLRSLGVEEVWNYQGTGRDVIDELRLGLPGGKADVVLNLVSGRLRARSLELVAAGGRFLDLAVAGLRAAEPLDFSCFADNQTYASVDCRRKCLQEPGWAQENLDRVCRLIEEGEVEPLPVNREFALEEYVEAYGWIQSRAGIGRVLLLPGKRKDGSERSVADSGSQLRAISNKRGCGVRSARGPGAGVDSVEFDLSEGQKGLYTIHCGNGSDRSYHVPIAFWWEGPWERSRFERALETLVAEQPAMRTVIRMGATGPRQVILPGIEWTLREGTLGSNGAGGIAEEVQEMVNEPFAWGQGPMWRAGAFTGADGRVLVCFVFHHILFDGQSLGILLEGCHRLCLDPESGVERVHPGDSAGMADFVEEERKYLVSAAYEADRGYWKGRNGIADLDWPADWLERGATPRVKTFALPRRLVTALEETARSQGRTAQSLYLAAFSFCLHAKVSGGSLAVGVPVDLRPSVEYDRVIHFFVNVLPVVTERKPGMAFGEFWAQAFQSFLEALEHRRYPYRRWAAAGGGRVRAAFYYQVWSSDPESGAIQRAMASRFLPGLHQAGEFDLVFEVLETAGDWQLNVKFNGLLEEVVTALAREYLDALFGIAGREREPDRSEAAEDRASEPGFPRSSCQGTGQGCDRGTGRGPPADKTVPELVQEQAASNPDAVAVLCGGRALTYGELDGASDRLAFYLQDQFAVGPDSRVGILMDRRCELPVALLGVLKARAAYVPLDAIYPHERLRVFAQDAGLRLILSVSSCRLTLPGVTRLDVDTLETGGRTVRIAARAGRERPGPEATAYIIYTSGSTGAPKGVVIRHRSLTHVLWHVSRQLECGPADRLLALTTISFDIAALELFLPLICGGSVEIVPDDVARDGIRLKQAIERSGATLIQATPATWKMLLAAGLGELPGTTVLCGGEAWNGELASALLSRARQVWNMYGPTETTIWSSMDRVKPGEPIRLGTPIGETQFYVLDAEMRPVPRGESGELYIGGEGLAQGYLNQPDLTRERFRPNPFMPGATLYRTGDLVRHV